MVNPKFRKLGKASDYGSGFHDVLVTINGTYQNTLPIFGYDNNAQGIKDLLNDKNWVVETVGDVGTSWIPGINGFVYEVYAVVSDIYNAEQVKASLKQDLSGFFNVTGATVSSGNVTAPASVDDKGVLDSILDAINGATKTTKDSVTPTILGFSVGTVLIVGLGAIILLKRR